jgi:hypothetical protein
MHQPFSNPIEEVLSLVPSGEYEIIFANTLLKIGEIVQGALGLSLTPTQRLETALLLLRFLEERGVIEVVPLKNSHLLKVKKLYG